MTWGEQSFYCSSKINVLVSVTRMAIIGHAIWFYNYYLTLFLLLLLSFQKPTTDRRPNLLLFLTQILYILKLNSRKLSQIVTHDNNKNVLNRNDSYYTCWHNIILKASPISPCNTKYRSSVSANVCYCVCLIFRTKTRSRFRNSWAIHSLHQLIFFIVII